MRIRKAFQGSIPPNKILDTYSTSQTDTYSCNYVNNFTNYSTSEIAVGKWINGKTIYRKVFTFTSVPSVISLNISGTVEDVVSSSCMVKQSGYPHWRNVPWLYASSTSFGGGDWAGGYYIRIDNKDIAFQVGSSLGNTEKGFLILEYTKTS